MKAIVIILCAAWSLALVSGCASQKPAGASCHGSRTHDWHAWNNVMPGPGAKKSFHITGKVNVDSGGWKADLVKRSPQGINPAILMLDLKVVPTGGSQVNPPTDDLDVEYIGKGATFKQVQVFCEQNLIADLKVEDVH